eukprot:PhF_6_TR19016/c0_g3_i1/m.27884
MLTPELCRRYLSSLDLGNNFLQCLPSCIHRLKSLRTLNVECNVISALPWELCRMPLLTELIVDNNPLVAETDKDAKKLGWLTRPAEEATCSVCGDCLETCPGLHETTMVHFLDVAGAKRVPILSVYCSAKCAESG